MKPPLFIVCGYIGVGKTTTAKMLGEMINSPVFSVDNVIARLFEKPSNFQKDAIFNETELKVCYNAFSLIAESLLKAGSSVIIDGAFARKSQRDLLIHTAQKTKSPCFILHITCPDAVAKQRCDDRFAKGEGVGWNGHTQLKKIFEPLDMKHASIDTSKNVKDQLSKFIQKIEE